MRREIHKWWSPALHKNMEIVVYGHYGNAFLMFPTAGADYLEYERFHMFDNIWHLVEQGKMKLYSINSINNESWLNNSMNPMDKAIRHQQYNSYVCDEVAPFIFNDCRGWVPVYTAGASLGALHALNTFFRRPEMFSGCIAMSGSYDLKDYTKGYWDQNVYYNSPEDYLRNLSNDWLLEKMRDHKKIIIATGEGDYEDPHASRALSGILNSKGIPHELSIWGREWPHDWPTWRAMFPFFVHNRF